MPWNGPKLRNSLPAKLAQLLDIEGDIEWSEQNPSEILQHQLAAPLLPDLLVVPGADVASLQSLIRERPPGETFLQHLTSEHPNLELLTGIKAFAHHIKNSLSNPLHGDPATVLYFATIAAALMHCQARISSLAQPQLREGFQWTFDQPGAHALRSLLLQALRAVSHG